VAIPSVTTHCYGLWIFYVGRNSSDDIVIRHGLDRPGIDCHQGQDFPRPFRHALGPASCTMDTLSLSWG
jgi:hypothetical protein